MKRNLDQNTIKLEISMTKATNILWNVDNKEDLDFLPEEVDLPDALRDEDDISDYFLI